MQTILDFVVGTTKGETGLFLVVLLASIWLYGIFILINAKKSTYQYQSTTPEYVPPEGASAILGRYIFTAGRMGGRIGELSKIGAQNIMFLSLYERGIFKKIDIREDELIYELDSAYQSKQLFDEEKLFLARLVTALGNSSTIHVRYIRSGKHGSRQIKNDSYEEINKIWLDFWSNDLKKVAIEKGYVLERFSRKVQIFLGAIHGAIGLGPFFAFFPPLLIIPAIFLWPFLLVAFLCTKLFSLFIPVITLTEQIIESKMIFPIYFISWFAWLLIILPKVSYLGFSYTEKGFEFVRKYKGYQYFLEKTDKDRLTLLFKNDQPTQKEHTSFSWLAVFSLATDSHWSQWNEFVKNNSSESKQI